MAPSRHTNAKTRAAAAARHSKKLGLTLVPYNGKDLRPPLQQAQMVDEITVHLKEIDKILGLDSNDPNTKGTAERVAKYWVYEMMKGRYNPLPDLREFPNGGYDGPPYGDMVVEAWSFVSSCAHHRLPFTGIVLVGIKFSQRTDSQLLGLSKYVRLVEDHASRPQLQERLGEHIVDALMDITKAEGAGVVMQAAHMCVACRGVRVSDLKTRSISLRGAFKKRHKAEFLGHVNSMLPPAF